MKRIHSSKELYEEIIKSFYLGSFEKNDQYMTLLETKEFYDVSQYIVEKVFKMLQQDGFLRSETCRGSFVTFDRNNPEHIAKVPLIQQNPKSQDFDTYSIPLMILSNSLYDGLLLADCERLTEYRLEIEKILQCLQNNESCGQLAVDFHLRIVSGTGNPCLVNIIEHFLSRYLYFNKARNLSLKDRITLKKTLQYFYGEFLSMIDMGDFSRIIPLTKSYYEVVYKIPNLLYFSVINEDTKIFRELASYRNLLNTVLITIRTNNLQKGDTLPTITELCKRYSVSRKTVRNAYDVLANIGLIIRKQGIRTELAADLDEPQIGNTIGKIFLEQAEYLSQVFDVLQRFSRGVLKETAAGVSPDVILKMRAELEAQSANMPYFVTDILITPIVMSLPMGVLQKYYFYLQQPMAKFISVCGVKYDLEEKNNEEIYRQMSVALDKLEQGDHKQYAEHAIQIQRMNEEMVLQTCYKKTEALINTKEG